MALWFPEGKRGDRWEIEGFSRPFQASPSKTSQQTCTAVARPQITSPQGLAEPPSYKYLAASASGPSQGAPNQSRPPCACRSPPKSASLTADTERLRSWVPFPVRPHDSPLLPSLRKKRRHLHREVHEPARAHTAGEWQNHDSDVEILTQSVAPDVASSSLRAGKAARGQTLLPLLPGRAASQSYSP